MTNYAIASTTASWAGELIRKYDREKAFEPMEKKATPLWNSFKEADDVEPRGAGLYFRLILNSANRVGTPTESGDIPGGGTRTTIQGVVNGVQVASSFEISKKARALGQGDGSFSADALHDAIVESMQNIYSHIERLLVVSHGTGKLGEVQTTTDTLTTVVMALPQGVFNIKAGMLLDWYDTDSGGSAQVQATYVTDVNFATRTLTLDRAVTLTAGWCAYISNYYGSAPNGLRGLVDDGTYATSVHSQLRATYPRLNAVVDGNSGTPRPYKEKVLRKLIHRLQHECESTPTVIWCNTGVISEHLETTIPDRQYTVSGKEVPKYGIGYDGGNLFFQYENNKIPFKISKDVPAREMFVLDMKTFKKHTLRKVDWLPGVDGPLMPTPSGSNSTYKLTDIACLMGDLNISCRKFVGNGVVRDLKDEELAGDSASV